MQGLGRRLEIPIGFGRRVDCLENLLQGAARYDRMSDLIGALEQSLLTAEEDRGRDSSCAIHASPWSSRRRETLRGLKTIQDALKSDS
jgi:hypothetical protein